MRPAERPAAAFALACAGLVLGVALAWAGVWQFEYLSYDDGAYVSHNWMVRRGLTLEGVAWAFGDFRINNYHPLTLLSHMLDVELFGLTPGAHHVINVLFHALNAILLFGALRALTQAPLPSLAVASLFSVHPALVEPVAWIAERKELLATGFAFASLWSWAVWVRAGAWGHYTLSLGLFAAALLAKPMPVTLPLILLLLDYWPLGRLRDAQELRQRVVEKLPFFALSLGFCLLTLRAQTLAITSDPALLERIPLALVAYARYLGHAFWPVGLTGFYPYRDAWPLLAVLGAAALAVGVLALAFLARRRWPWLSVGMLWFSGALVPVTGIVQAGLQSLGDRFLYFPMPGLLVAVCFSLAALLEQRKRVLAAVWIAVLALGVVGTRAGAAYWRDDLSFFEHSLEVAGPSFTTFSGLGHGQLKANLLEEAEASYRASLELWRDHGPAHVGLGILLLRRDEAEMALRHFDSAARANPLPEYFSFWAGQANEQLGRVRPAAASYLAELELNPDHGESLVRAATLLATRAEVSDPGLAHALALHACQLTGFARARELDVLAATLAAQGRYPDAETRARDALWLAREAGDERLLRAIAGRLARYRARQPLRVPQP